MGATPFPRQAAPIDILPGRDRGLVARSSAPGIPAAIAEWGQAIPELACKVWTGAEEALWAKAVAAGVEAHWGEVVAIVRKVVDKNHSKRDYVTLRHAMANWSSIINGSLNWLLADEDARGGKKSGVSNFEAIRKEAMRQLEAGEIR